MKVGTLIRDKKFPQDMGVIVEIDYTSYTNYCKVVGTQGVVNWLPRDYIESECEVVSEGR